MLSVLITLHLQTIFDTCVCTFMICLRTKTCFRSVGRTSTAACRHLCNTYAAQTTPTNCDTPPSVNCTRYHLFFLVLQNLFCICQHIILYLCAQAHVSLSPTLSYSLVFLHVLDLTFQPLAGTRNALLLGELF